MLRIRKIFYGSGPLVPYPDFTDPNPAHPTATIFYGSGPSPPYPDIPTHTSAVDPKLLFTDPVRL